MLRYDNMEKEFFDIQLMIKNIYKIINIYLNSGGNVCELSIDFYNKDSKLDYNKPQVQSSYLLKYALGYSFEYYYMYNHIKSSFINKKEINILSLGCGSCIDYWALCLLLYRENNNLKINYMGIDKIKWTSNNIENTFDKNDIDTYKFTKRKFDNCYFVENEINILSYYDDIFSDNINNILNNLDIIIFPRSIGEIFIDETNNINTENINIVKNIISNVRKDEIYILSSIYANNHYHLLNGLSKRYYSINLDSEFAYKGIYGIDNYFEYPDDIKCMYTNLCEYYVENKNNRCNKGINKNCHINNEPILHASKLKYRIKKITL